MRQTAKTRLRETRGFSLTETLAAMIILLLVTGIAAGSFPVVRSAYESAIDAANAHTLLNTAAIALRNELCLAKDGELLDRSEDGKNAGLCGFLYTDPSSGYQSKLYLKNDEDGHPTGIWVERFVNWETEASEKPEPQKLLPEANEKSGLRVVYRDVDLTGDGLFLIYGLSVEKLPRNGEPVTLESQDITVRTANWSSGENSEPGV